MFEFMYNIEYILKKSKCCYNVAKNDTNTSMFKNHSPWFTPGDNNMAANMFRVIGSQSHRTLLSPHLMSSLKLTGVRHITRNDNGAILPKPPQVRFGLVKVSSLHV